MDYEIIYSTRKTLAIQITPKGQTLVRAPYGLSKDRILEFLYQKREWVVRKKEEALAAQEQKARCERIIMTEKERAFYIKRARDILRQRVDYYAPRMGVTYGRLTVREQRTRFGSCSSKGNLSFNWKLILMPEEVLDYVVVHELAHRKMMNHSKQFYAIVQGVLPDYKSRQQWLKENGAGILSDIEIK